MDYFFISRQRLGVSTVSVGKVKSLLVLHTKQKQKRTVAIKKIK